jgi:hypothetical protein
MGILVEQLLVWLGARPATELTRWYSVALGRAGEHTLLRLVPRDAALKKHVKAIAITLDAGLAIRSVEVTQKGGDSSLITFDRIERNAALKAGVFQ